MQENPLVSSPLFVVRPAIPDDTHLLAELIGQLAAHHGDQATTNAEHLRADLFATSPWAIALVAERDDGLLGYAVLVRLYQAQLAKRAMDLHHLFVLPAARGSGVGTALICSAKLAAKAEGCARLMVGTTQTIIARKASTESLASRMLRWQVRGSVSSLKQKHSAMSAHTTPT